MTFHGSTHASNDIFNKAHESPIVMTAPLAFLAVGSIFSGVFLSDYFIGSKENDFWFVSIILSHNDYHLPFFQTLIIKLSVAFGVLSAALVYFYRKELANSLVQNLRPLYSLSFNKWYVDELYNNIFTRPFFYLASLFWKRGDTQLIDEYGPNGVSRLINFFSKGLSLFQSGYLYHYAFVMLGGLVIILTWFVYY